MAEENSKIKFEGDTSGVVKPLDDLKKKSDETKNSLKDLGDKGEQSLKKSEEAAKKFQKSLGDARSAVVGAADNLNKFVSALNISNGQLRSGVNNLVSFASAASRIVQSLQDGSRQGGIWVGVISASITALTELVTHLNEVEQAQIRASLAAEKHSKALDDITRIIREERATDELQAGLRSVTEQTNALTNAEDRLAALRRQQGEQSTQLERAQTRLAAIVQRRAEQLGVEESAITRSQISVGALRDEYDQLQRTITRLTGSTENLTSQITTQQWNVIQLAGALANAQSREREIARERDRQTRARQAHAEAIRRENEALKRQFERYQEMIDIQLRWRRQDAAMRDARTREVERDLELIERVTERQRDANQRILDADEARARRERELTRERIDQQRAIAAEVASTTNDYRNSWLGSQEDVLNSFREANRASAIAGRQLRSNLDLVAKSLEQTGNQALSSLGENFANAFAKATTAAIVGAQSFEDSMILMTQALLEQLTQQAIVQSIVQLASALGALASQQYDRAALHFASMAAWIAVGAAAGIGLAVVSPEAEKVKARQSAEQDSKRDEERDRRRSEQQQQQRQAPTGQTTIIFNQPFMVRDELTRTLRRENQRLDRQGF